MNPQFVRDAVNAVLLLYNERGRSWDDHAKRLADFREFRLDVPDAVFGGAWRVANAAKALAATEDLPLRHALLSTAHVCYQHCLRKDSRFRGSFDEVLADMAAAAPFSEVEIVEIFARELQGLGAAAGPPADRTRDGHNSGNVMPDDAGTPAPEVSETDGVSASSDRRITFATPPPKTLREKFEDLLRYFPAADSDENDSLEHALAAFHSSIKAILVVADAGRTFTEFALLNQDLSHLEPRLAQLKQTDDPRTIQDRARHSRALAEAIDFGSGSPDDYACARSLWLLSAFWNSQLARYWPASRPHVVYDFLGYLTTIQAERRYSDADFLLLLRVSFSICRIASHDGLMPYQFLNTATERSREWLQHTVGTILVTAGPERVTPSRTLFDSRLVRLDRREYARSLLYRWRSDAERAAAVTMLLEMGGWDAQRANRLLEQVLPERGSEFELWRDLVQKMATRSKRVRVVRPNPWGPSTDKPITVEREAVATLAADVVDRHYQVLEGNIALKGNDFRERRVPTYVCWAEFGPLGLFKLDTAERIGREVDNFARYGQRLHPRYRASRCDHSEAVITEPDDEKQFVQGALTSYVFTEDETPRTLNAWFLDASAEQASSICDELFECALRPWYAHAASATIDIFAEFPMFQRAAVDRVVGDCRKHHSIDVCESGRDRDLGGAVRWITSLLNHLDGIDVYDEAISAIASELQVLRSYRSVCHGDLHMDNVLVVGRAGAEYPCVIDFEATQEGYILKDFGRFVAAAICRTFNWSPEERQLVAEATVPVLLDWKVTPAEATRSPNVNKVVAVILAARKGVLRAWQAGCYPTKPELVATLVASFLPFARYSDTATNNARLCFEISSRFVAALG